MRIECAVGGGAQFDFDAKVTLSFLDVGSVQAGYIYIYIKPPSRLICRKVGPGGRPLS